MLSDIKNIIKDEKITFIDIHEQVFSKVQDPMKYIPSGGVFHYNKYGYEETANVIEKQIRLL